MKIIMLHNYYQIRGGEDESFEAEVRLLRDAGHDVVTYTEHNDRVNTIGALRTAGRTIWSRSSNERVARILGEHRPDVVHIQNFFPLLSPSVSYAAHSAGVPVVQTLRNYRLWCLDHAFYRDGHVCEDCMGKFVPWPGVLHACYRDRRSASTAVALMITVHRVLRTWHRQVDLFIALTSFARGKYVQGGLPADKIVVKPNFIAPDPGLGSHDGGYALFVGRLSEEKGIRTLLRAWERAQPPLGLKIVGDGLLAGTVKDHAAQHSGVEYLGRQPLSRVSELMGGAAFLVFPSEWYETFGRVAIEAFSRGTPVIASDIGAIAEVVTPNKTGYLFTPGDIAALANTISKAASDLSGLHAMGAAARREYEQKYTAEANYRALLSIYEEARGRARGMERQRNEEVS